MREPSADELLGILCRVDLSPSARLAWMYLLRETRAGEPWPSLTRLGVALGVTERWAREVVRELVAAGEIHRDDEDGIPRFPAVDAQRIRYVDTREKEQTFRAASSGV